MLRDFQAQGRKKFTPYRPAKSPSLQGGGRG